eukprot:TRINITY_DN13064_c0_g1_i4.p1 TRINITY_DN13064_c0_g1~~TRINITY_DN13064_c0_g1_i4.p1  ORF type:complete len:338 (+),score=-22.25 TRINITY_DN13064_c0_g1_i4:630-1643(+)
MQQKCFVICQKVQYLPAHDTSNHVIRHFIPLIKIPFFPLQYIVLLYIKGKKRVFLLIYKAALHRQQTFIIKRSFQLHNENVVTKIVLGKKTNLGYRPFRVTIIVWTTFKTSFIKAKANFFQKRVAFLASLHRMKLNYKTIQIRTRSLSQMLFSFILVKLMQMDVFQQSWFPHFLISVSVQILLFTTAVPDQFCVAFQSSGVGLFGQFQNFGVLVYQAFAICRCIYLIIGGIMDMFINGFFQITNWDLFLGVLCGQIWQCKSRVLQKIAPNYYVVLFAYTVITFLLNCLHKASVCPHKKSSAHEVTLLVIRCESCVSRNTVFSHKNYKTLCMYILSGI